MAGSEGPGTRKLRSSRLAQRKTQRSEPGPPGTTVDRQERPLRHRKSRAKPSSPTSDKVSVENALAASAESQTGGTPGGPPNHPIEHKAEGRRSRWRRRLFWAFAIAVALVVGLRISLGLSLPWIINKTVTPYGLAAHYERLDLSLLTGDAELWHLALASTDTNTPLTDVEYCRAKGSLLTLLTRRLVVPRVEIDGMDVSVTRSRA